MDSSHVSLIHMQVNQKGFARVEALYLPTLRADCLCYQQHLCGILSSISSIYCAYVQLRSDGFDHFRCDRNLSMGVSLNNMAKILKCMGNDDVLTMKV